MVFKLRLCVCVLHKPCPKEIKPYVQKNANTISNKYKHITHLSHFII